MRVSVDVERGTRENDRGIEVPTTEVICSRCANEAWAWGAGEDSTTRCLVKLRDTCPKDESNYYVE